jgi:hypothetical protein
MIYLQQPKIQHFLASLVMQTELLSTVVASAEHEIETHESPTFAPKLPASSITDPLESLHIPGDADFQSKIRSLSDSHLYEEEIYLIPVYLVGGLKPVTSRIYFSERTVGCDPSCEIQSQTFSTLSGTSPANRCDAESMSCN